MRCERLGGRDGGRDRDQGREKIRREGERSEVKENRAEGGR